MSNNNEDGQAYSMTKMTDTVLSRRKLLGGFAGISMIVAAPVYAKAPGYLKRAGNIRRVTLRSGRTGESVDTIYWIEGQYIKPALEEINYFMRDWRENSVKNIDRRQIDIIAAAHHMLDTTEPFQMLSGYRTPRTNAMLRRKSRRVAKSSYHVKAMATDVRLSSRSVSQMARAATAFRAGGVGRYSHNNFVHIDSGPIRTWGA
jgi:uncharacterized protein YcbK (DUF882 family)